MYPRISFHTWICCAKVLLNDLHGNRMSLICIYGSFWKCFLLFYFFEFHSLHLRVEWFMILILSQCVHLDDDGIFFSFGHLFFLLKSYIESCFILIARANGTVFNNLVVEICTVCFAINKHVFRWESDHFFCFAYVVFRFCAKVMDFLGSIFRSSELRITKFLPRIHVVFGWSHSVMVRLTSLNIWKKMLNTLRLQRTRFPYGQTCNASWLSLILWPWGQDSAVTVLTGRSIAFHTVITKFMYKICDDRI